MSVYKIGSRIKKMKLIVKHNRRFQMPNIMRALPAVFLNDKKLSLGRIDEASNLMNSMSKKGLYRSI